jgi:outer membrane protein TolC
MRISILQMKRIVALVQCLFLFIVINAQQQNLDYYLKAGLNNSPLLKDYKNRVKSTLIDSMRIRAGQGLQVNAASINSYAPVIHNWGYDEVKTDIAQVSALVGISKEIKGSSNLSNRYQAIRLQNLSTNLEGSLSEKDLKKEITSQYILAYGDQQNYKLNSQVLDILRQEEKIVKKLTEQGVYKQTEYLSFLVNVRQQEIITSQSDFQFKTDLELINYTCGIFDTSIVVLSEPGLDAKIAEELHKTLFYRQFVADSLKLVNAGRQIDFDYRPTLSVYADGGYLSSLALTPWKNFGASVGLSLAVPIYDGRQRKMQHDQIAISEASRSNYLSFFENRYSQQISMLRRQLASVDQIMRQTMEQMTYVQTLIDANHQLLNSGDIPVTDYLLSISNYLNAKSLLIENTTTRFRIVNELNYWSEK